MIFLTNAPNDQDLLKYFGGLAIPAPIPHGDFNFFGYWEDGRPISVAGERKKIGDIMNCITDTGRYLSQWQALIENGFERVFLIVEGYVRPGQNGLLEVRKGKDWKTYYPDIEHRRFYSYLDEVSNYLGVQVKMTHTPRETALAVISLYLMYSESPETHSSLKQFHNPKTVAHLYGRPSLIRRVAKEFDDIHWDRGLAVEKHFKSVYEMINADESEWMKIDGIGKKIATKTVQSIRQEIR